MIARRDPSPSRSGAAGSGGLRHRHPGPAAPAQWLDATRPLPGRSQRHDPAAAHLPLLRRESLTHGARQARRPRPSISPYYERVHRLALVTGAGRGIGRAIALRLAADGCAVALAARSGAEIDEVARAAGGRALPLVLDVTDPAAVTDTVARVARELGP